MKVVNKIKRSLKRNPCSKCDYYNMPHNPKGWCQSKKVCNNGYGRVTWFDRMFCESYIEGKDVEG